MKHAGKTKFFGVLAALLTLGAAQAAFAQEEAPAVKVMALKGPTAMGMVQLMDQADTGQISDYDYQFTIAASADEVTPQLVQGNADIAAIPANLASVLYNNTDGQVEVLAINTLGVLYIVESGDTVSSVADLKGKTIYASGKGSTPEYALNYILSENGIDPENDVTIEWKSEHTECLSALLADEDAIAMLPQPFVTTAQTKSDSIRVALDLTEEWDKLQADSSQPSALITGVMVARTDFVEENPQAVLRKATFGDNSPSLTFCRFLTLLLPRTFLSPQNSPSACQKSPFSSVSHLALQRLGI